MKKKGRHVRVFPSFLRVSWKARSARAVSLRLLRALFPLFDAYRSYLADAAKELTVQQARRTGDFLLLYEELQCWGLQPAVVKGIVLRSLYPQPEQRASVDEDFFVSEEEFAPLLENILSGGLYGVEDINRAHSSTLTLEAVAAQRLGRRRGGVLRSVFLPLSSMAGKYPYLRRHKWLLPVAWTQRVWGLPLSSK